ncbi:hypothetical protein AAFN60_07475 [Roseibacillus persicicus]|uniref:hypothetical protein n=1 Tax=Roseibacillus persicicus TaxID=454148 RepID=UPI00398B820B
MIAQTEETKEITRGYYNELVTFLKASEEAIEHSKVDFKPAQDLLSDTKAHYERAIQSLEDISGMRYGDPKVTTKIADGLAQATATLSSFFSGIGDHENSKILRDHFVSLQAASCGFQMLYTTEVSGYGKSNTSQALLGLITVHHRLVMRFAEVIPATVAHELSQEDETNFDTRRTEGIVDDLKSTWK